VTVNVQVTETPEARMKNLLKAAFDEIPEHEKVSGHPTRVCYELLLKSPDEMLTVVSTCLRACFEANLPPSVTTAPGKSLFQSAYVIFSKNKNQNGKDMKETKARESEDGNGNPKQRSLQTWQDTNELLNQMILLLFSKASEHLKAGERG